jgi:hypothetical protein
VFIGDRVRSSECQTDVHFRQSVVQERDPQCPVQLEARSVRRVCLRCGLITTHPTAVAPPYDLQL